jgi:hypothetical protein
LEERPGEGNVAVAMDVQHSRPCTLATQMRSIGSTAMKAVSDSIKRPRI